MPWLQLFVDTHRDQITVIEDALLQAGAASVTLQEHIPQGQQEQPILEPALGETPLWDHSRVTGLFDASCDTKQVIETLKKQVSPLPKTLWEQLEDKDWEREWMDNYHPIQCAEKLWICPSWQSPPDPDAVNLLLDPGLAFGTGTHPTTFLCMQWLAEQKINNVEVIDYGCGSGILGITALLLGAKKTTGIDIDPQALLASHDNVKRNGLKIEQFPVYLPQQKPLKEGCADIMLANILAGPLVELSDTLISPLKVNGRICLSGILATQAKEVEKAYSNKITFAPIAEKDGWVRLSGHRYR